MDSHRLQDYMQAPYHSIYFMALHCSPIRVYIQNILNCNFQNGLLFLLPLEICTCPSFCPAALGRQSFILFTWQTPTCYFNLLILGSVPCSPETHSGAPMFSPRQPILTCIATLKPFSLIICLLF